MSAGQLHGVLGDVHGGDVFRPGLGAVEGEGPGVGAAVQHPAAGGQGRRGPAIILLVQEKAGLLAVDVVHVIADAVFYQLQMPVQVRGQAGEGVEALFLGQAFLVPQGGLVALVDGADRDAVILQQLDEQG